MIAELSQCVATIFSLWLAAEPDQPPPAAEASPQISTRASSVQPSSPPEPGSAVSAPQQLGGEDSVDAVSAAAGEAQQAAGGADAAGSAVVSAVVEPTTHAVEALVMRQPPARTAFVSREDLELALRAATDLQPAAADLESNVHQANSLAEVSDIGAATEEDGPPARVMDRLRQDLDAVIGTTAAAAEGGISYGQEAAAASGELHMDGGRGVEELLDGVAPNAGDNGSESEGVMDGLMPPEALPKAARSAMHDGVGNAAAATAGDPAPDSGDDPSDALLDGMAAVDEGTASKGFDMFGENGGSGIHELNEGFTDATFADWDASADDAMQFGAPVLPPEVALPLCFSCTWVLLCLSSPHLRSSMLMHAVHAARWTIISVSLAC